MVGNTYVLRACEVGMMVYAELLPILKQGVIYWNTWRRLQREVRIDFRDADLRGIDLQGADLREIFLMRADLSGVDLRQADLRRTHLRGADLRGANLWKA